MINLGQNWGVKDSGLLAYKQVGSKYFNKDFDFTRASNGTYVDKNGVLQTAELYNLMPYSQDFSQWTAGANTTITSGQSDADGGLNAFRVEMPNLSGTYLQQNNVLEIGKTYTLSVYAKSNGNTNLTLYYGSENVQDVKVLTDTWQRYSFTFTYNSGSNNVGFGNGSGTIDCFLYKPQLVEGTEPLDYQYTNGRVGIPRIDFSDGVGALLLEPQRTNLLLQSNSFDTTWTLSNGATLGSRVTSPFGGNDAWEINFASTIGSRIQQNVSVVDGSSYVFSFYAKVPSGTQNLYIYSTISGGPKNITLTDQWQRFEVSRTNVGNTQAFPQIRSNTGVAFTAYIYAAQYELGTYPTSIIETTTSAVTRIADVANNCGSEQDFNSEEGVLYAEIKRFNGDTSTTTLSINDGSVSNMVSFYYFSTDKVYFDILSSSPNVSGFVAVDDTFSFNKIALKYKSGDIAMWINGQEVLTRTNTISLSGLNELSLSYGDNTAPLNGKVRSVKYFPEALTDEQLENLTT